MESRPINRLLLAIALLAVVVAACSPATEPGSAPASVAMPAGSPASSPNPAPAQAWAAGKGLAWRRIAFPEDLNQFTVRITAIIGGFVLSGEEKAPMWSLDGTSWRWLKEAPRFAAVWGDGTSEGAVAFGCVEPLPEPCRNSALWHTADGLSWQPATGMDFRRVTIVDVAANNGRLLAVGTTCPPYPTTNGCYRQTLVIGSTDGVHWSRLPGPPGSAGASLSQIQAFGKGFTILGARDPTAGSARTSSYLWSSADGEIWSDGILLMDTGWLPILSVTGGRGLVLLANGQPDPVTALTSSDGRNWVGPSSLPAFQDAFVVWLGRIGSSIVAVTRPQDPEKTAPYIGIWVSADGLTWERRNGPGDPYQHATMAATNGKRLVVVAESLKADGTYVEPDIWVGEPAG